MDLLASGDEGGEERGGRRSRLASAAAYRLSALGAHGPVARLSPRVRVGSLAALVAVAAGAVVLTSGGSAPTEAPLAGRRDPTGLGRPDTVLRPATTDATVVLLGTTPPQAFAVDSRRVVGLPVPPGWHDRRVTAAVPLAGGPLAGGPLAGGLLAAIAPRRAATGGPDDVLALRPGPPARRLGTAHGLRAGGDGGAWLETVRGGRYAATRVEPDGRLGAELALPPGVRPLGGTRTRLVVAGSPAGRAAPIAAVDPATGRLVRGVGRGVAHDTDGRRVLWSTCPARCPYRVTDLDTGETAELATNGARLTGPVLLAPDGRHWAAAVAEGSGRAGVIVGHLPWTGRGDRLSRPLTGLPVGSGRLRMAYARSGWLFASTGRELRAVGPGPHRAGPALPGVPAHDGIAVG